MKIIINLFSSAREACGFAERQMDFPDKSSVGDVVNILLNEYNELANLKGALFFAVNEEYCDESRILQEGDILSIFPPVSGGQPSVKKIILQKEPIDTAQIIKDLGTGEDGAIAVFIGRPRRNSSVREVKYIGYEIFESMAKKEIEKIVNDVFARWPVTDCIVVHRYGRVEIGEASIIIALSSPHREEAFNSVRYIIDTIKKTVPIWKTEYYSDGASQVFDRS